MSLYQKLETWCLANRKLATTPAFILLLVLANPSIFSLSLGAIVVCLGEMGRIWSSGYIDKNAKLATAGPYRLTRNPLYFFNAVIFFGFCIMAANPWAALFGLVSFTIIYRATMRSEAEYIAPIFGDEFTRWAEVVPMFWPKWTNYPAQGQFSWALVAKHREQKNALAMLAGIILFIGIYIIRSAS
jgi:isoprenylcysteine carboxyl methyltransferase (ICMT) family protein YpbQ